MNDLEKFFKEKGNRNSHKWYHYLEIYDRHFSRFRNKEINILEFGVFDGGSLQMWKKYFGSKVNVYGVDINERCKEFEEDNVKIFIGDQEDKDFLLKLTQEIPIVDILIDDGGHTMKQQINTFEVMFNHVKNGGVYLCEDLHTSYWGRFGGGYNKPTTFIEYSKKFIDDLHRWHSKSIRLNRSKKSIYSVIYYDSVIVIEKRRNRKPRSIMNFKREGKL